MKILAIHSVGWPGATNPPVHIWRVFRPLRELAKHTDFEIDYQHHLVESLVGEENKTDFTETELEVACQSLGQYDVVFCSYSILNAAAYTLMLATTDRHGTQFVIDYDDDVFSVNDDNPIWLTLSRERMAHLQIIATAAPWLTVSTERLARLLRARRPTFRSDTVMVIPNYISDDYVHPPIKHDDKVVIGYFGGSSHWNDVHDSGFRKAMMRIVKDFPQVHVRMAGVPLDIPISESRMSFLDASRGLDWVTEAFPQLDMDIVAAPLLDNPFNWSKSNIKWQEATRMGAPVIASMVGPYADLANGPDEPTPIYLVPNTKNAWYEGLKDLVLNKSYRMSLAVNAQEELAANWRLEDHWQAYQAMFERVSSAKTANMQ